MGDQSVGFDGESITIIDNQEAQQEPSVSQTEKGANGAGDAEQQPVEELKKQSDEENRKYAAVRRDAQEKERKRYEGQLQREKDAFYAREYSGVVNPYNNRPIQTEADFLAYKAAYEAEEREQKLSKAGLDASTIQAIVEQSPTMQAARNLLEEANRQKEIAQQQQVDSFIESQFSELHRRFHDAEKNLQELSESKNGREIIGLWSKGVPLVQAYAAVSFDELTAKAVSSAKQAALNNLSGKEHLVSTIGTAGEDVQVPSDVMQMYKTLMPKASESEIKQHYQKHHK